MAATPVTFAQKIKCSKTAQANVNLEESVFVAIDDTDPIKEDGIISAAPVYEATWLNSVRVTLPAASNEAAIWGVNYYDVLAGEASTVVTHGCIAVRVADGATVASMTAGVTAYVELGTGRVLLGTDVGASTDPVGLFMSNVRSGLGYTATTQGIGSGAGDANAEGVKGLFPFDGRPSDVTKGDVPINYILVEISAPRS
jgi:hypothetical protein